jgi:hypothetical protein
MNQDDWQLLSKLKVARLTLEGKNERAKKGKMKGQKKETLTAKNKI